MKITAVDKRGSHVVTVESSADDKSFFRVALNVFEGLNNNATSVEMIRSFLVAVVDYMITEEAEWIAGDKEACDEQDKYILFAIKALESFPPCVLHEGLIRQAKEYLAENDRQRKEEGDQ